MYRIEGKMAENLEYKREVSDIRYELNTSAIERLKKSLIRD